LPLLSWEECNHQRLASGVETALEGARLPGSLTGGVAKTGETDVCLEWRDLCLCEEAYEGDEEGEISSGRQESVLLQHLRTLSEAVVVISGHGKKGPNPILQEGG